MYEELVKRLRSAESNYQETLDCLSEAADAIEELMRRCEQFQYMPPPAWIPVTERLPEPKFAREWYLVSLRSGCVKTLAFEKGGRTDNLFRPGWHETASPVTHWMPLPQPPKEEET